MTQETDMNTSSSRGKSRWKRIAAILALLLGGFVIFLSFGLGITDSEGIAPGAIVVFGTMLIVGGGLMAWGVAELRA